MDDELLENLLGSNDIPFSNNTNTPTPVEANNEKKKESRKSDFNPWETSEYEKTKPDHTKFKKSGKSYMLILGETVPQEYATILTKIMTALTSKQFVTRYQFDSKSNAYNPFINIQGLTIEAYRPWTKMAPELEHVARTTCSLEASKIASYYAKTYNKFPPAVRIIRANAIHALLGAFLDNPVNFVVAYTSCGSETITSNTDLKKIGLITSVYGACRDLNIPIYNIKNKESVSKLVEFIKTL